MKTPNQYREIFERRRDIKEVMLFERRIGELMFSIASKLVDKVKSFQLMKDDDFVHRRGRTANDIHIFFKLKKLVSLQQIIAAKNKI